MRKWLAVGVFVLLVCGLLPKVVFAKDMKVDDRRTFVVSGVAETVLDAEYAKVYFSVKEVRTEAVESYNEAEKTIKKMYIALKAAGIKESEIKKSIVYQGLEYKKGGLFKTVDNFYSIVNMNVTVTDISLLSRVYRALTSNTSVTIESTEFKRRDEFEQKQELYKKAATAARAKADVVTKALGTSIARTISVKEQFNSSVPSVAGYYGENARVIGVFASHAPSAKEAGSDSGGTYGSIRMEVRLDVIFELR